MLSISASSGRAESSAPLRPFTVPTASTVRRDVGIAPYEVLSAVGCRAGCPHPAACETDGFGKHPYCAFNLTGRTIYKKLSLPSVGVITQGEILVFRAKRTVSAGAYRRASMR